MNLTTRVCAALGGTVLYSGLIAITTVAQAETTRLDNEFFAFKPTKILTTKVSGKWTANPPLINLGLVGKKFSMDTRKAANFVPAACRQLFSSSSRIPKMNEKQQMLIKGNGCDVTVQMQAPYFAEYDDSEFKGILPKGNRLSLSKGRMDFRIQGQISTLDFAVLVSNVQ